MREQRRNFDSLISRSPTALLPLWVDKPTARRGYSAGTSLGSSISTWITSDAEGFLVERNFSFCLSTDCLLHIFHMKTALQSSLPSPQTSISTISVYGDRKLMQPTINAWIKSSAGCESDTLLPATIPSRGPGTQNVTGCLTLFTSFFPTRFFLSSRVHPIPLQSP